MIMKELVLFSLLASLNSVLAAKTLVICPVASPSHSLWCYQYILALAERGHQITVLGVDEPKIKIPNLRRFITRDPYEAMYNSPDKLDISQFTAEDKSKFNYLKEFAEFVRVSTKAILHSKAMKELINTYKNETKPFDLIIHDSSAHISFLGLVHVFGNPPLLQASTYGSPQWMMRKVGNMFNPAYVPSMISPMEQKMTFYERCENLFYYLLVEYVSTCIMETGEDKQMKEFFGQDLPSPVEIARRSNIIIVNQHPALHDPRPLLPGVIGIAGLHIPEKPKPLPQEIKEFLDGAENGAILLSFGTNVDSNWLPKDFENVIIKGLEQLPQRVFWKWTHEVTNLPKNVKVGKWLPQGDMLTHPNLRLFVSHCGLMSTQEAIYHKVPILALPVFGDQLDNAAMLVRRNLSIRLNIHKLTSEELRDGILEVLSNPMYKKNIENLGELMHDMPQTARQQAVFWTEYAIRHQGAPHLRAAVADMPWYQLLLLDVLALAGVILVIALWLAKALLSCIFRTLCASSKEKND